MNETKNSFDLKTENSLAFRMVIWSALAYSLVGIVALGLAVIAVPPTGLAYPYLDTLQQYPRDYLWQYAAIAMLVLYLVLCTSLASAVAPGRRVVANLGLVFAAMACVVLIPTYYLQETVVPISLMKDETEGLALLTQYNPHGTFIALEEIGYLLMLGSLVAQGVVFCGKDPAERAVRIVSAVSTLGVAAALAVTTVWYGLDKKDSFEIATILFVWIANIVNGFLIHGIFRRRIRELR